MGHQAIRLSGLRSVEHVKEHQHTEAREHINQRRKQRHRWNHITYNPQRGGNEICRYPNRQQEHSYRCQKCRTLDAHDGSMNVLSVIRKRESAHGYLRHEPYYGHLISGHYACQLDRTLDVVTTGQRQRKSETIN